MLDTLQIVLWSITYVLIIIAGFQSTKIKKVSIPYLAAIQNFAWEICALIKSHGFWGHIAWFSLDLIIIILGFLYIDSRRNRVVYIAAIPVAIALFNFIITVPNGMLYSSFVIDLLMAVYFVADCKKLSPKLKLPIAFTKLLGDLCAGLYYAPKSAFIEVVACLVFLCNTIYLYLCTKEIQLQLENNRKKRKQS